MSLTVAIPAHNDCASLLRLLRMLRALGCAEQIVVVDDGSQEPLQGTVLQAAAGLGAGQLQLLRHETAKGAGAARNLALAHVRTSRVLFLDADDRPTRALPWLLQDLAGQDFDFCLFQHHDTRREAQAAFGQMPYDQVFWDAAGLSLGALSPVTPFAAAQLVQTSNYPWNKIYRTAFLREHGIGCSETPVHNDIELHWMSFLKARRILASTQPAVLHQVSGTGGRLTNRTGAERLQVFIPLARVAAEIQDRSLDLYLQPFWSFFAGLMQWVKNNLDPRLHPQLAQRTSAFLAAHAQAAPANLPGLLEAPAAERRRA
ncbi:glycosyltransferase family 2 protein [Leisingera sp. McT4-56]|uniref:glycosyltransferase family 2 protein n=1 Tax=Leisingera sp. McT4-56 TaxID=2881255 RepID=UPI001CF8FD0C|nr:glycosyltransferase family A protein [Leisingera sp. McT4-56]MCB4457215.1 glycosyltransferase family 2 protein [Leisingera sp. McT4-56]